MLVELIKKKNKNKKLEGGGGGKEEMGGWEKWQGKGGIWVGIDGGNRSSIGNQTTVAYTS